MKQDTATQTIALPYALGLEWVSQNPLSHSSGCTKLILDFALTERIDSAAVALIHLSQKRWSGAGKQLILRNIRPDILESLRSWQSAKTAAQSAVVPPEPFFTRLGSQAVSFYAICIQALSVFTEMVYWGSLGLVHKRDFRKGILGEQMYQLGFKALGIVTLLSFLIGVVLALQSALFLKAYGAGIFLASMIGWSMLREFGPLLTAIILAGRTGSATTAEIATMGVGEELDALQTMGINPIQFVVVPKFWAITITMPMLSIISTAAGILGGFFVSLLYLDISSSLFWNELYKSIKLKDFMAGFLKSIAFSWLIIWIGAFYGLKVKGGAEAVGRETTASVVTCIFIIIIADALFSFLV